MKVGFSNMTPKPRQGVRSQSPKEKKAWMSKFQNQENDPFFFVTRGVVHKEFASPSVTVNEKYYLEILDLLRKVMWARMEIADDWILHHDKAPAFSVREFLAEKCIHVFPQVPYSSNLSPRDFAFFQKLKLRVKGYHFRTLYSSQESVTDAVKSLTEGDFQSCYEAWVKCIAS